MPPAELRCTGSPHSWALLATLWCQKHHPPVGPRKGQPVNDARLRRDRAHGRAMALCATAISAMVLISASARVVHAAAPDSVRSPSAAKVDEDSLRGRSGKLRAVLV